MPIGTIINVIAILIGGTIGLLLHNKFPKHIRAIVFQALGVCTIVIGVQMALEVRNLIILIFSIVIGGIVGEWIALETKVEQMSEWLKTSLKFKDEKFTDGLVTTFLLSCVGSMTIVGAIDEGVRGDRTLLLTKSMLDGFSSIALASTYGVGVLFSVIPIFILQGGLTVFAAQFTGIASEALIAQITANGGVLIVGMALTLLEVKKIHVINMLPSLVVTVLLSVVFL